MKVWRFGTVTVVFMALVVLACGSSNVRAFVDPGSSAPDGGGGPPENGAVDAALLFSPDGGGGASFAPDGGVACPSGLACDVACSDGGTTTVTGTVYDPAGANPLYDVVVYVPARPLAPLPKGVLVGADACSCDALFPSGALANTTTAVDGTFTLTNVPVGAGVPLVLQLGKWRREVKIDVAACQPNAQPARSLAFLGTIPPGDTDDSIPDIAVSTGGADTLECLMLRIGLEASEFVAGADPSGHVHLFTGGAGSAGAGAGGGSGTGGAENPPFAGAPESYVALWDRPADLMPYDVLLLSCEGGETYNANPPALEAYLNAGGRAFASHFHYAWFAGSILHDPSVPPAPADWGANLADWAPSLATQTTGAAEIVETLTGSTKPFWKGIMFDHWLKAVGALGVEGAPPGELPIYYEQKDVGAARGAQAWLVDNGYTDYLSFDTPVGAPAPPDGGAPAYCGRAVFSDIHLDSDSAGDTNPPPGGCVARPLSPEEKALEFMLFDLSSCVLPDTVPPSAGGGFPPPR